MAIVLHHVLLDQGLNVFADRGVRSSSNLSLDVFDQMLGEVDRDLHGFTAPVWLAHRLSLSSLFYVFANAFEKGDESFAPRILLSEVFADFDGCFFTAVVKAFDVQEVLPLGRSRCFE